MKKAKCKFMQESVQYLGYIVDAQGLHTSPDKIQAIKEAPQPKNQQQLRAFLGLVNYYGKFLPTLSTTTHPLNQLLQHNSKWAWSKDCQAAFQTLKQQSSSEPVLAHYDSSLPLKLACDASPYGVGAVISHIMPSGEEKPIAYGSRTLSKAERNYAQVEKEALAIIFGIKKFHQYVYGRKFLIVTDHKPLTMILSPKASLPTLAAARLQRWAITLSAYHYEIEFRPTKQHANTDSLSRLPLENALTTDTDKSVTLFNIQQIGTLPVQAKQLRQETANDPLLSKVLLYTKEGWPREVDAQLQPFSRRKLELTIESGCLMWGIKVIILNKLQGRVLEELHTGQIGIVKMKALARSHVWWPGMEQQIEQMAQKCEPCQSLRNRPAPIPLHPWTWPTHPWQRLHIDFAGPFLGKSFLIIVDAHSKWPEVIPMMTTTAEKTMAELRQVFAIHRLREQIVSDNRVQFTSDLFQQFLKENGIKHVCSAPHHPSTNGEAERFVQTFKNGMRAAKNDSGTFETKLARFLLVYCSTPNTTTGESPSQLLFHCQLQTRLSLVTPDVSATVANKQSDQKNCHDKQGKQREFELNQPVLVADYSSNSKWIPGVVLSKLGPMNYEVLVNNKVWKRQVDQILKSTQLPEMNTTEQIDEDTTFQFPFTHDKPQTSETATANACYPSRVRRPPDRLIYD